MPNVFFILILLQVQLLLGSSQDPRHLILDVHNQSGVIPSLIFRVTEYKIPAEFTKLEEIGPSDLAKCQSITHTVQARIKKDKKSRLLFRTKLLPDPTRTISIAYAEDPMKEVLYTIQNTGNANYKIVTLHKKQAKAFRTRKQSKVTLKCSLFGFLSQQ